MYFLQTDYKMSWKNSVLITHVWGSIYLKKIESRTSRVIWFVVSNVFVLIRVWVLYIYNLVFSTWYFFSCLLSTLIFTWLSSSFSQLLFYFYLKSKSCVDFPCHVSDLYIHLIDLFSALLSFFSGSLIQTSSSNHKFSSGTLLISVFLSSVVEDLGSLKGIIHPGYIIFVCVFLCFNLHICRFPEFFLF